MSGERNERLYRFDPLDASGIFLGLSAIQCALVGGGLVAAVAGLSFALPFPVASLPIVVGAAGAFGRAGGRALWEWLPLAGSWAAARFGRGPTWQPSLPLLTDNDGSGPPVLPPCLAGLAIVEFDGRAGPFGAVRDEHRHTATVVVPTAGVEFLTRESDEQASLLSGWGDVLGQFAAEHTPVVQLGWSDLARPSGLDQHHGWLDTTRPPDVPTAAVESYGELLAGAASQATSHDVVLFLTVATDRLPRHRRDGPDALAEAVASSLDALHRSLRAAGLWGYEPLTVSQLRAVLRTRIDPHPSPVSSGRLVDRLGLVPAAAAGPMVLEANWRHVRIDAAWHRAYWIAAYPRLPQHPPWMEPFLATPGVCRAITVTFQPVTAHQSRRRIERDLVKLESDAQTREEKGRRVDARHRRATQALLDREAELVAGYPEMGYIALAAVSGRDPEELDRHCDLLEQHARECGIELRALDARHDLGWAATLPFGLAPRHLLAP